MATTLRWSTTGAADGLTEKAGNALRSRLGSSSGLRHRGDAAQQVYAAAGAALLGRRPACYSRCSMATKRSMRRVRIALSRIRPAVKVGLRPTSRAMLARLTLLEEASRALVPSFGVDH